MTISGADIPHNRTAALRLQERGRLLPRLSCYVRNHGVFEPYSRMNVSRHQKLSLEKLPIRPGVPVEIAYAIDDEAR